MHFFFFFVSRLDQYDTIDSDDSDADLEDNYDEDSQSSNEGGDDVQIERKVHTRIMDEDDLVPSVKAPERATFYSISDLQLSVKSRKVASSTKY